MRPCRTAEADVGLRYFFTDADGTGGRLKLTPDDFVVDEIQDGPPEVPGGKYVVATVTVRNWETNRLIRVMSRVLGISRDVIGFAGTKDKRAVTSQLMSFRTSRERLAKLDLNDVALSDAYVANRPITIGDLVGNSFKITVREPDVPDVAPAVDEIGCMLREAGGFPNYFGVQRFGSARPITHRIGEAIVRGDFEGAVNLYLTDPSEFEADEVSEAREALSAMGGDFSDAPEMPKTMGFESAMVNHLRANPGDWAGAIGSLPNNLQMMFVHAYQSKIFNEILSKRMELGLPLKTPVEGDTVIPSDARGVPSHVEPVTVTKRNRDLVMRQFRLGRAHVAAPLFGSESEFSGGEMGEIERSVIGAEGLERRDFLVPALPRCSSRGSFREIFSPVKGLSWESRGDSYVVSFSLPKGNYATCLMREFMKSDMHLY
ncbi:MAG: tRNA pseudouridine(13) synthase TruD [Thermoplasmatales archaeon]|nr:tRNA pseudouridine(13) synthase TruD [Thermoplasmatales archaeon]